MPVPLTLAAPAAAAALAYLNARTSFWYDMLLLKSALTGTMRVAWDGYLDHINMFYFFEARAKASSTASKPLLLFEGKSFTYAESYNLVLRYGAWMRSKFDIKPGDIVAMDFCNSHNFVFVWLGLWSIGAKPAFINYNLTGKPLTHCVRVATTRLCLVDPDVAQNITDEVKAELPDVRFVTFTPDDEADAVAHPAVRAPDSDRSGQLFNDMALLIYTSGTTGLPKPAVVSWAKCVVGGSVAERLIDRGNDIMYTSMPLYHSSAALLSFCATILSGSTQALGRRFSTKTFWAEVRATEATNIQYVGETLRYLLAAPPEYDPVTGECLDKKHHVRAAFGNGLRPDIWNKFKERFGVETVCEFYAATEGSFGTWNVSTNDFAAGAVGRNGLIYSGLLYRNLALVETDLETGQPWRDPRTGRCKVVKSGEPGELLFKLPAKDPTKRFQGYYNNKEATASKIMRDVFAKGDAWFSTGDVIRWDRDGRVYFNDRLGDTFRWKSENVSTAEVSQAVGLHPAVNEANVYGVELPHHDGRAGCAAVFLVGKPDAETMHSLAAHVRAALPRHAQPLFLRIAAGEIGGAGVQATGTNKQQKQVLRAAGVGPNAARDSQLGALYWLSGEAYVPFGDKEWRELKSGRVRL